MLGGGTFITKDKVLPGTYINFVSAEKSNNILSERGIAAIPIVTGWGPEGDVIAIHANDFKEDCLKLFGYDYTHEKMRNFRELFKNAATLLCYRLNTASQKASCDLAEALYGGNRGNAIKIVIRKNVDDDTKYDVETMFEHMVVDKQVVGEGTELIKNDFVSFKPAAILAETVGQPLQGGTNGAEQTGEDYQKFLDKIQSYTFHALGCTTKDTSIMNLFVAYTKRMRNEMGMKFQTIVYRGTDIDDEGVVSVQNKVDLEIQSSHNEQDLIYWVTGALAGCTINKSLTNKIYDGEYQIDTDYTQRQLADGMKTGKFLMHKVGKEVRVLTDINTLVTTVEGKNEDLKSNQTIRVLDQIGNDIAAIFNNQYLGVVPNDQSGRISLWDSIVSYYKELSRIRAIETVEAKDVVVEPGNTKKSVVVSTPIIPINCMEQLYMTVVVQ